MPEFIEVSKLIAIMRAMRDEFQREANQSILKHDHAQGMSALGGLDAIQRVESRIESVCGVQFPAGAADKIRVLRGRRG